MLVGGVDGMLVGGVLEILVGRVVGMLVGGVVVPLGVYFLGLKTGVLVCHTGL